MSWAAASRASSVSLRPAFLAGLSQGTGREGVDGPGLSGRRESAAGFPRVRRANCPQPLPAPLPFGVLGVSELDPSLTGPAQARGCGVSW